MGAFSIAFTKGTDVIGEIVVPDGITEEDSLKYITEEDSLKYLISED